MVLLIELSKKKDYWPRKINKLLLSQDNQDIQKVLKN